MDQRRNERRERRKKRLKESSSVSSVEELPSVSLDGGRHQRCESCHETQVRLQEMNEKLDQLLTIMPAFQEDLKKLEKESMEMTSGLKVLNTEVEELRKEVAKLRQNANDTQARTYQLKKETHSLKERNIQLEARSRRDNMKFLE